MVHTIAFAKWFALPTAEITEIGDFVRVGLVCGSFIRPVWGPTPMVYIRRVVRSPSGGCFPTICMTQCGLLASAFLRQLRS